MGSFHSAPLSSEQVRRALVEGPRPATTRSADPAPLVKGEDRFQARAPEEQAPAAGVAAFDSFATETPTRWAALMEVAGVILDRGGPTPDPSTLDLLG